MIEEGEYVVDGQCLVVKHNNPHMLEKATNLFKTEDFKRFIEMFNGYSSHLNKSDLETLYSPLFFNLVNAPVGVEARERIE